MNAAEIDRFWSKVNKRGPNECWPFGKSNSYGTFTDDHGKTHRANRIALQLSGVALPAGIFACHKCDNPPCCNPAHLFAGTHADNMQDMSKKGRPLLLAKLRHAERHREIFGTA